MTELETDEFIGWMSGKVFMVVEDATSSRLLEAALLRSMGAQKVLAAVDGNDALAKLTQADPVPDILICDWMMPGLDGIGLLTEAKKRYPAIRVVMLTAKGEMDDVKLARTMGADGYVAKPFTREGLVSALKRLMT
ncbi:FOG: CheY-like receiver [Candidatus Terasakiella magnetica]|nr:FOG: CheY-like receiver [Candidatus Terasakiella magnetica]